jgi:hypothetical protein
MRDEKDRVEVKRSRCPRLGSERPPPHGKISSAVGEKTGHRWKQIDPDRLAEYKKHATINLERYKKEWKYTLVATASCRGSREQLKAIVDEETKAKYFAQVE